MENKNNYDDFINKVIEDTFAEAGMDEAIAVIPNLVYILKTIYDEMKKKGFDDMISYDFAKSVVLNNNS